MEIYLHHFIYKSKLRSNVLVTAFLLLYSTILCSKGPGTTAANFLKIAVGPRQVALGESFTAAANDVNTIFFNPAGIENIQTHEVSLVYNRWFEDILHGSIAYTYPKTKFGSFGIGAIYLTMPDIQGYSDTDPDAPDHKTSPIKVSDCALLLTYARNLFTNEIFHKGVLFGINLKYINQNIEKFSASAFAMDLGLITNIKGYLSTGLAIQNLGTKIKFHTTEGALPLLVKFGVSKTFFNEALLFSIDSNFPIDNKIYFSTGLEYRLLNMLYLRAGYRTGLDIGIGITAGIGLKYKFVQLDYAFVNYGTLLGNTHRIGLILRLPVPRH